MDPSQQHDSKVEDEIRNRNRKAAGIDPENDPAQTNTNPGYQGEGKEPEGQNTGSDSSQGQENEGNQQGQQQGNQKQGVDNDQNNSQNNSSSSSDQSSDSDGPSYDDVVDHILETQYDGDPEKRSEAKAVANLAVQNFDGDVKKASKSYRELFKDKMNIQEELKGYKNVVQNNPVLKSLMEQARQRGGQLDNETIRSVINGNNQSGTATSADQPNQQARSDDGATDLPDEEKIRLRDISENDLVEQGYLDQGDLDQTTGMDRREMILDARMQYAQDRLPDVIANRTEKKREQKQQEKRNKEIKDENRARLQESLRRASNKFNIDFQDNPEHRQLYEQVMRKATMIPDLDSDGEYVAHDAVERAVQKVFSDHGVPLEQSRIPEGQNDQQQGQGDGQVRAGPEGGPRQTTVDLDEQNRQMAYRRVLGEAESYSSQNAGDRGKPQGDQNQQNENSLDRRVREGVRNRVKSERDTSRMISGQRQYDKSKS